MSPKNWAKTLGVLAFFSVTIATAAEVIKNTELSGLEKSASDIQNCSFDNLTKLTFADPQRSHFTIPTVYIEDIIHAKGMDADSDIYEAEEVSALLLAIDKDLNPEKCTGEKLNWNKNTLRAWRFKNWFMTAKTKYSQASPESDKNFLIFVSPYPKPPELKETFELRIPKDKKYADELALECHYYKDDARASMSHCEVNSKISEDLTLIYRIPPSQISDYKKINDGKKELILKFYDGEDEDVSKQLTPKEKKPPYDESAKDTCGDPRKVLFKFNDEHHTQFLIPEAYLDNSYSGYHKVKDPAEFIKIRLNKADYSPKCKPGIGALEEDIHLTIHPYSLSYIIDNHRSSYPEFIKSEFGSLNLYRKSKNQEVSWETKDFLIPADEELAKKIFIECAYSISKTPTERVGCTVVSELTNGSRMKYVIPANDLSNYQEINQNIKNLLMSFHVQNIGEKP